MRVQSLGGEDPLEEDMATHPVFLLGIRIPNPVFLPGKSHRQKSLVDSTHIMLSHDFCFRAFYLFYSILILNNRPSTIFALK